MRLGPALANAESGNKDEHAEAAVAMSERLMKSLRSMGYSPAWNRRIRLGKV
jgi:hypothetical protein